VKQFFQTISCYKLIVRLGFRNILAAIPDFALCGSFLITWFFPKLLGEAMVRHFMYVMILEFIVVHSTALLGNITFQSIPRKEKIKYFAGLAGFYTLMVLVFAFVGKNWWMMWAFLGLTVAKFPSVLMDPPSGQEKEMIQRTWAMMCFLYVMGAMLTVFIPFPAFGITKEIIAQQGFTATGLWVEKPHRVIAMGVFYFGILGYCELTGKLRPKAVTAETGP